MEKEFNDFTIKYNDSQIIKNKVFDRIMEFFIKHECFDGESLCQMDNPQIEAPMLLSEIADDVIKFEVDWKE